MELIAKEYRGEIEDLCHYGYIVVSKADGTTDCKLGDPGYTAYSRSSAKPIQAIPVVESGAMEKYGITEEELALICASHLGEDCHIEAVKRILNKAGLDENDLKCGSQGLKTPLHNNCSGKHAGMLVTAKIRGESLSDYYLPNHQVQERITKTVAEVCGCDADQTRLGIAIDACGVPVHAMPIYKFAQGYAKMSKPELFGTEREKAVRRITAAMTEHPEMVGGTGDFTTDLMRAFGGGLFCKSGAGGFFAIGLKGRGIGIAMKIKDGSSGIIPIAALKTLVQIGAVMREEIEAFPEFRFEKDNLVQDIKNYRGETVGRRESVFTLR